MSPALATSTSISTATSVSNSVKPAVVAAGAFFLLLLICLVVAGWRHELQMYIQGVRVWAANLPWGSFVFSSYLFPTSRESGPPPHGNMDGTQASPTSHPVPGGGPPGLHNGRGGTSGRAHNRSDRAASVTLPNC